MSLARFACVLALTTAFVVVVGAGAVHIYYSYERETSRIEQRPLVPLGRSVVAESREPRSRWTATSEGGAQGESLDETTGSCSQETLSHKGQRGVALTTGRNGSGGSAGSVGVRCPSFRVLASRAAALCGVPEAVLFGLIARESSWRQYDAHGRILRSSAGALGLTQIKPGSAREISASLNPHDPWGNLVAGSCYLAKYRRGGTWRTALMRYRLGPNYRRATRAAHAYVETIMEGVE